MKSKAFKLFGNAVKYARANSINTILKAGDFYIVQDTQSYTELAVLERKTTELPNNTFDSWPYAGYVGRDHLKRLGNANWATRN